MESLGPEAVAACDPQGMRAWVEAWPRQTREQRARLSSAAWPGPSIQRIPRVLAVGALGGSAMGAELVRGLCDDALPFPFLIVRDYSWPACVGPGALCVLSSYSGNTEETLALYDEAGQRGADRVSLSSGGELSRRSQRDGVPCASLPAGLPPRAALGYSLVSLLVLVNALGCPGGGETALSEALEVLEAGNRRLAPEVPEAENPAKKMALALRGKIAVIYTAAPFLSGVGLRWKGQINENAKTPAFANTLPESNHNETVGWEALSDLHPRFAAICLRDREENPRTGRQMDWTAGMLTEQGLTVLGAVSTGGSRLARILSLVQLGDWVSLYLAVLAGVDPVPIVKIDALKKALGATG
jgi:glucose/mannose-6-phosphate isomerase